ncbi:MAG: hypothetical protein WKF78_04335 [Candidatus Limnocylindrales bacterium]
MADSPKQAPGRWTIGRWTILLIIVVMVAVVLAVVVIRTPRAAVPWARLKTSDVHSLAFTGADLDRVLFGHHGGLSASTDGGRSWAALRLSDDAMATAPGIDGSIVIAGHDVFRASHDGGLTWARIVTDLPSLDIHGFARAPSDPDLMWAYPATGGLWRSADARSDVHRGSDRQPAVSDGSRPGSPTRLLGIDVTGLVESADGGRTWTALGTPPTCPMTALAASGDGRVLYAGAQDGLYRSVDGGGSWSATSYGGSVFALAASADGQTVILVDRATDVYRSDDGGETWPGPG